MKRGPTAIEFRLFKTRAAILSRSEDTGELLLLVKAITGGFGC